MTPAKHGDDRSEKGGGLPKPIVKKMRWPFPIIWAVPVVAAILTAFFLRDKIRERGPEITIQFNDGSGLKPGQTQLVIHGVQVGQVSSVDLSEDQKHVLVHVSLHRNEISIAKKQTLFWIVRPEVSLQAISGLGAILSGPYIEARPGDGEAMWEFEGSDSPPIAMGKGIRLVLHTDHLAHVQIDTPVMYRGFQVGAVQDIRLSAMADQVNVTVFIREGYTALARTNSEFWTVSGADIRGGVLTGVKVKLDSLSSILSGGVAFATPEKGMGPAAGDGAQFELHDEEDKDWLKWKPQIQLPPQPDVTGSAADHGSGGDKKNESKHDELPAVKSE